MLKFDIFQYLCTLSVAVPPQVIRRYISPLEDKNFLEINILGLISTLRQPCIIMPVCSLENRQKLQDVQGCTPGLIEYCSAQLLSKYTYQTEGIGAIILTFNLPCNVAIIQFYGKELVTRHQSRQTTARSRQIYRPPQKYGKQENHLILKESENLSYNNAPWPIQKVGQKWDEYIQLGPIRKQ